MGLSVHIFRQSDDGGRVPITLDEWNAYIESDRDLRRPEPGNLNYSGSIALLPSDSSDPDNWQWIAWTSGSLHSDYPQPPMLKKMVQVARYFGAVVSSDDGDLWEIDENGHVSIPATPGSCMGGASSSQAGGAASARASSQPPPLPGAEAASIKQPWFLFIQGSEQGGESESVNQLFAEAIRASLKDSPVSIPIVDLEEACSIAERLIELGCKVAVSGYDRTKSVRAE